MAAWNVLFHHQHSPSEVAIEPLQVSGVEGQGSSKDIVIGEVFLEAKDVFVEMEGISQVE